MFENCLARSVSASIRSVILKVRHAVREYRGSIRLSLPFKVAPKSDFVPGRAPCPPSIRNWPLGGPRHKASAPGGKESLPPIHVPWNPSGPSGNTGRSYKTFPPRGHPPIISGQNSDKSKRLPITRIKKSGGPKQILGVSSILVVK